MRPEQPSSGSHVGSSGSSSVDGLHLFRGAAQGSRDNLVRRSRELDLSSSRRSLPVRTIFHDSTDTQDRVESRRVVDRGFALVSRSSDNQNALLLKLIVELLRSSWRLFRTSSSQKNQLGTSFNTLFDSNLHICFKRNTLIIQTSDNEEIKGRGYTQGAYAVVLTCYNSGEVSSITENVLVPLLNGFPEPIVVVLSLNLGSIEVSRRQINAGGHNTDLLGSRTHLELIGLDHGATVRHFLHGRNGGH